MTPAAPTEASATVMAQVSDAVGRLAARAALARWSVRTALVCQDCGAEAAVGHRLLAGGAVTAPHRFCTSCGWIETLD
jgi:hypothetical protein